MLMMIHLRTAGRIVVGHSVRSRPVREREPVRSLDIGLSSLMDQSFVPFFRQRSA
jgi:hypothetical protein